jgi:outer membrane protein
MIRTIAIIVSFICVSAISMAVYHFCFAPKPAFIDIPKVFNGFTMKNEMQKKYQRTESIRNKIVDSLSMDLQLLSNRVKSDPKNQALINEFDMKRQYFFSMKNKTEEDNAVLSEQYDKQILEQMSTYILEYGKKNGFDFIYGSSGNGTLMYASDKYNISEEIITFINSKYNGLE